MDPNRNGAMQNGTNPQRTTEHSRNNHNEEGGISHLTTPELQALFDTPSPEPAGISHLTTPELQALFDTPSPEPAGISHLTTPELQALFDTPSPEAELVNGKPTPPGATLSPEAESRSGASTSPGGTPSTIGEIPGGAAARNELAPITRSHLVEDPSDEHPANGWQYADGADWDDPIFEGREMADMEEQSMHPGPSHEGSGWGAADETHAGSTQRENRPGNTTGSTQQPPPPPPGSGPTYRVLSGSPDTLLSSPGNMHGPGLAYRALSDSPATLLNSPLTSPGTLLPDSPSSFVYASSCEDDSMQTPGHIPFSRPDPSLNKPCVNGPYSLNCVPQHCSGNQVIAAEDNVAVRFELFLLGDGEKKVTEETDTRIPNASVFTFNKEDHTLGNLLTSQLLKNPHVKFSGYKVPHPLFSTFELRVQTDGSIPPKAALVTACRDLVNDLGTLSREFTKEWELRKMAGEGAGVDK